MRALDAQHMESAFPMWHAALTPTAWVASTLPLPQQDRQEAPLQRPRSVRGVPAPHPGTPDPAAHIPVPHTPEPHNTPPHNLVPCIPVPHSLAPHPLPSLLTPAPHPSILTPTFHPPSSPLYPHPTPSPLHPIPQASGLGFSACMYPSMVPQTRAPLPSSAHLVRCPLAGARWAARPCVRAAGAPARAAWGTGPPRTSAAGWPCAPVGAAHSRSGRPRGPSSCLRAQSRALQWEHRPAPHGLASPPRPFPGPGGLRLEGET